MIAVWKTISVLTRIWVRFRALACVVVEAVLDGEVEAVLVDEVVLDSVLRITTVGAAVLVVVASIVEEAVEEAVEELMVVLGVGAKVDELVVPIVVVEELVVVLGVKVELDELVVPIVVVLELEDGTAVLVGVELVDGTAVLEETVEELVAVLGARVDVELVIGTAVLGAVELVDGTTVLDEVEIASDAVEFCTEIPPLQAGTKSWILHKLPAIS
jgi:hypothetical protein